MFTEEFSKRVVEELQKIDPLKIRVSTKSPKIFLCGGELEADLKKKPKCVRDYILRELKKDADNLDKIVLAESIFSQFRERTLFTSLLDLESAISAFCTSVVIVLESPGSIAELGSFCMDLSIREKLYVFINQQHNESTSYIKDGPLAEISDEKIFSYDWPLSNNAQTFHDSLAEITPLILEDLNPLLEAEGRTTAFDKSNIFHLASLMGAFCQIMFPLQVSEAKEMFMHMGIEVKKTDLMKAARVGVLFGDFIKKDFGNEFFYPSDDDRVVSFKTKTGQKIFDVAELNVLSVSYLKSNASKERRRLSAVKAFKDMGLYK